MNAKTMLEPTAPKYLRRLSRELNSLPDGFYSTNGAGKENLRFSRARFTGGRLEARRVWEDGIARWQDVTGLHFCDTYGRDVFVSRKP